jgi:UDP-galactopyranose mutase
MARHTNCLVSSATNKKQFVMRSLVVFSHLRWSFVRQRPQHLMTRLAHRYAVHFIEEPIHCDGPAHWERHEAAPGVTVWVPRTPVNAPGFADAQHPTLRRLLARAAASMGLPGAIVWLYTPMALPLAQRLKPRLLVYDCMDQQAGGDPAVLLRQREAELLDRADLVFTCGPSLYEAHRGRHPKVYCLPSAVDSAHFSPLRLKPDEQALHADALQGTLPRPRLGFHGVIDERLDLKLIDGLAEARPQWQLMMAGPVVDIDPLSLPRRPNIHWLGMQPYERLPYLIQGWDICLMPFLLNAATAFLSPNKTLEYMAAEKPVVSTPVRDVELLYGSVVRLAQGLMDFVAACDTTLSEPPRERARRAMDMLSTVSSQSWNSAASAVHQLMSEALAAPRDPRPLRIGGSARLRPAVASALPAGRP